MPTFSIDSLNVERLRPEHVGACFLTTEPDGINTRVVIDGGRIINQHFALALGGSRPLVAHRLAGNLFSGIRIATPDLRVRLPDVPAAPRQRYATGGLVVDATSCKVVIAWSGGFGSDDSALLDLSDWRMQEDFRLEDPSMFFSEWELVYGSKQHPEILGSFRAA